MTYTTAARRSLGILFPIALLLAHCGCLRVQAQQTNAKSMITTVCESELKADHNDHTAFQYFDHDVTPDHNTMVYTVETPQGDLSREMEVDNRPLTAAERDKDNAHIQSIVANPTALEKQNKDQAHDDDQAEQMLALLPNAFLWTIKSEQGPLVTLSFKPDPAYDPHSMEDRVFAAMAGQVVVNREENRIYSMRGTLTSDVKFGFGILGRLRKGGTFQVERREVLPGHWQMTDTHVHLIGKALFFKTIGSQEDEQRGDFKLSPARTLAAAGELLPRN